MMGCISVCFSVLQYVTVYFCTDLGAAQLEHSVFSLFRFHFLLQVAAVDFRGCGQKRSMMACVAVRCSVLQCVALKFCEDLVTARLEHSLFFLGNFCCIWRLQISPRIWAQLICQLPSAQSDVAAVDFPADLGTNDLSTDIVYGLATIRRLLKIIRLFGEYRSLL